MAKQSFTVGQVLTAAQLTSLQQTAMLGGAASAKTASYTLVAADAGTTISMTSTSATTVTVNTGLFAAGDTVFIQNLGSGNLTITAGTATVATAGSLILPQNDAGILYFVSTSSSVFYDFIQVGATSPLTTKGDLYTFSTSDARLGVGANGTTLVADSSEATGLKWATASAGGMTLLSTTALSSTSTTISGINQTYTNLVLYIPTLTFSANAVLSFDFGASNYYVVRQQNNSFTYDNAAGNVRTSSAGTTNFSGVYVEINRYSDAAHHTGNLAYFDANLGATGNTWFSLNNAAAVSSIAIGSVAGTATFTAGSVYTYGVK